MKTYRRARRRSRELQTCTETSSKRLGGRGWRGGREWEVVFAGYSPGRSVGLQEHSPSLCYPQDPLQPADLRLRGCPVKSSLRPHPSRAPARPLSPAPPDPGLYSVSPDTSRHSRRTRADCRGCQLDLTNTLDASLPPAGAQAGLQAPSPRKAPGLPLEECPPAFPGIGWR